MGKPKKQKCAPIAGQATEKPGKQLKKSYTVSTSEVAGGQTDHPKITLSHDLEKAVLDLIQDDRKTRKPDKDVSKRLTSRRLMDVYSCLSDAGFEHSQIEKAMSNVLPYGGDVLDALDWLCLYTPNDQLPASFSQTLLKEVERKRPKFTPFDQEDKSEIFINTNIVQAQQARKHESSIDNTTTGAEANGSSESSSMKSWILRYAQLDSDEDDDEAGDNSNVIKEVYDPNSRYLSLTTELSDAKERASLAKQWVNKTAQNEASRCIRTIIAELDTIEADPNFNQALKVNPSSSQKTAVKSEPVADNVQANNSNSKVASAGKKVVANAYHEGDIGLGGFDLMEEHAAAVPAKPKPTSAPNVIAPVDVRNFEYTRQQWTGKSPKQFLIDWCRKHLPKSNPPKYERVPMKGTHHISRCKVQRKEGDLVVTPEIASTTLKDAEHLSSTLALYQLCKGQAIHQLLPPPYRVIWLEWLDAEKALEQESKKMKNKPRDDFISKLMKKLKITDTKYEEEENKAESVHESWEHLGDEDESIDALFANNRPDIGSHTRPCLNTDPDRMKSIFLERQATQSYQELLAARQQLPVFAHRSRIMETLWQHNVLVVAGETGCGKSTQIPQFLLENYISHGKADQCQILCTQPRRISTISLSKRVSQELGENGPGSKDSFCGYQIRFESRKTDTTRLIYCTTGVLLRRLQVDPELKGVTHVIVDEVHERSMQSDFLLIILREMIQRRKDLHIILMSATVDSEKFSSYFFHCPVITIPGRTFQVQLHYLEDVIEQTRYVLEDDSPYAVRADNLLKEEHTTVQVSEKGGNQHKMQLFWTKGDAHSVDNSGLDSDQYSLKTRNIVTRLHPYRINMDLIMETLTYISTSSKYQAVEGSVLIFLPGLMEIQQLYDLLTNDKRFSDLSKYMVLALHSVLSTDQQNVVFTVLPRGMRKIVLATNIAETGITIPDVVFVIDCGKVKETRYLESSQMTSLQETYVSKASAKQRQGRAGRVREGHCFRLYTKVKYESLSSYTVPELLRVPLEELCLHIMKCELGNPQEFLAKAVDPPQSLIVTRAMSLLEEVGACYYGTDTLTSLGHHLATLPVHVRVGKMLLFGSMLGCLEPVAVIAAAMTEKSPFASPLSNRDQADLAKRSLATACSDHITLYKAYIGWKSAHGKRGQQTYCHANFLKYNTLCEIENVKNDLLKLIHSIGFKNTEDNMSRRSANITGDLDPDVITMVKAVLTAGLYPNVAKVTYERRVDADANPSKDVCVMETAQGSAAAHPTSVNRYLEMTGWLVFHEKVKLKRVYVRESTLISPYPLLLFGGEIDVQHMQKQVSVDRWINFQAYAKTGVIFKELRLLLDRLLRQKLEDPTYSLQGNKLLSVITRLLMSEKT